MLSLALLFALKFAPPSPDVHYMAPQVFSTGDKVMLTFASGDTIFYSYSDNDGQTFSRPVTITAPGKIAMGRHRGPRIAYHAGNVIISAIVGKTGKRGEDGDLLAWTSADNGKTWSKPVKVNDSPDATREGLHSMAVGNGWVVAAWLDLRAKGTRLYGARSDDGGLTWGKNFVIYESPDGTICQCCHPTILVGPGGVIHVMWRNVMDGSRDLYVTRSENGGKTWQAAKKIGLDTWKLNACPMDGGGLTVTGDGTIYTVWRRDGDIFVARPEGKESKLGEGKDPSITSGLNDELFAAWTGKDGSIQVRSRSNNKARTVSPKGAYPQVLFTGRAMLVFFEQDGGIAMENVGSRVPQSSGGSR